MAFTLPGQTSNQDEAVSTAESSPQGNGFALPQSEPQQTTTEPANTGSNDDVSIGDSVERGVLNLQRAFAGFLASEEQSSNANSSQVEQAITQTPTLSDAVASVVYDRPFEAGVANEASADAIQGYDRELAQLPEATWDNVDGVGDAFQFAGHLAAEELPSAAAALATSVATRNPIPAMALAGAETAGSVQADQITQYGEVTNEDVATGVGAVSALTSGLMDYRTGQRAVKQIAQAADEIYVQRPVREAIEGTAETLTDIVNDTDINSAASAPWVREQAAKMLSALGDVAKGTAPSRTVKTGAQGVGQELTESAVGSGIDAALQSSASQAVDSEGDINLGDIDPSQVGEDALAGFFGGGTVGAMTSGVTGATSVIAKHTIAPMVQRRLNDTQDTDTESQPTPENIIADAEGAIQSITEVETDAAGIPIPERDIPVAGSTEQASLSELLQGVDTGGDTQANQAIRDIQQVEDEVRRGGQSSSFLRGAEQYYSTAQDLINRGQTEDAQRVIAKFNSFAENHIRKSEAARTLLNEQLANGTTEGAPLTFTDINGETKVAGQLTQTAGGRVMADVNNPTRIHRGSGNLVRTMEREADYLRQVTPFINDIPNRPATASSTLTDATGQPDSTPEPTITQLDDTTSEISTSSGNYTMKAVAPVQSQTTKQINNVISQTYGDIETAGIASTGNITVNRPATELDVKEGRATEVGQVIDTPDTENTLIAVGSQDDGTLRYVINESAATVSPATLATAQRNVATIANNNALRKDTDAEAMKPIVSQ
ncbi:hypothetical protein JCM19239_5304 [Vibrio variabilis]|uniref:Uncharacterized protein n=1 Tax=Vibrio variabilis TaxID=990271 RepID=A0ABQ0JNQ0_9VIBR|nr:hypothetical protein JCM19239_5304 [Vibrio variabilis]